MLIIKHNFIVLLFHYIALQFLAHTLCFAEAQHSTNKGLEVRHTFSAVIED